MSSGFPGEAKGTQPEEREQRDDFDLLALERYIHDIRAFLPVAVCQVTPRGVIIDAVEAFSTLLDYSEGELTGTALRGHFKREHEFDYIHKTTLAEGGVSNCLTTMQTREGDEIRAEVSTLLRRDEEGKCLGYFASFVDVSEREQADAALRDSEDKFRSVIEHSLQGIIIIQNDPFRIRFVNPALIKIVGYSYQEMVDFSLERMDELIPDEDRSRVLKRMQDVFAGGSLSSPSYQFRIKRKDGSIGWIETTGTRIKYEGDPALQISVRDITNRRRIEVELKEREQEYLRLSTEFKGILDALPDNLTFQHPDLKVVWANRTAAGSVNKEVDEVQGEYCYALWHGRKEPCVGCPVKRAMQEKKPIVGEMSTPDGRYWEVRGVPIMEGGVVRGAVEIARDITRRKKMENELRESEEKYRLLLEQSGDIITYFNEEGVCLAMNRNAAAGFESSPEGAAGRNLAELFDREIAASALGRIKRVAESGESEEHEDYVRFPRGEGWFRSSYNIVRGAKGNVIGVRLSRVISPREDEWKKNSSGASD